MKKKVYKYDELEANELTDKELECQLQCLDYEIEYRQALERCIEDGC